MIKLCNENEAINKIDNDYIVIVSPKEEFYYKNKFLKKNYKIFTLNNFIVNEYNGPLNKANDIQSFLIMYKAYLSVKKKLKRYNDVLNISFISDLLSTYKDFFDYEFNNNDKIDDLKLIYDTYEELLIKEGLINCKMIFEYALKNLKFNFNYVFLGIESLSKNEYKLISKMNDEGNVILSVDGFDKELINNIKDNFNVNYSYKDNKINKSTDFLAFNDIEEELQYVLNDISKKIMDNNKYKDFIIVSKDISLYEPYFHFVFDFPYSKCSYTGILTSRFIKIFSSILNGDFSCKNFMNLLKLDLFDIDIKKVDILDNYIYEWDLEDKSFYIPFVNKSNILNLEELNNIREDIINQLRYFLENVVGVKDVKVILKEFWTYLSELKIDEKLFQKDPDGYNNFVILSENISDYFNLPISVENIFEIISSLSEKKVVNNNFLDEVVISNINEAFYKDKKYVYLIGADSSSLPSEFKLPKLLENNDINEECLINKINEFLSLEEANFNRLTNNDNFKISYHKLSSDLSLKFPSSYLSGNVIKPEYGLYNKSLIMNRYSSLLSEEKVYTINGDDELIKKINRAYYHDLNFKISKESAKKLYSNHMICSPSSIEMYSKCQFYHFCQYGLKLNIKEKRLFDNRMIGSLVHFILEKIIKNNFNDAEEKTRYYAYKYFEENDKLIDNVTKYVIDNIIKSTSMLLKNIIKEGNVSLFKPRYLELKVDAKSIIKPITINLDEGSITINGIVDRIDVCETIDKYYYRVIDYKTGVKKLRLDDCLDGLNLQMLLYLLAIKESSSSLTNKEAIASAVLYYPALIKEEKISRSLNEDEIKEGISKRLLADGIINRSNDVIEVLGNDEIGNYIDVISRGKINDEKTFSVDELNILFDEIKRNIKKIGDDVLNGNITVKPVKGRVDACSFCKFSSICGFDKEKDSIKRLKNYKNSEVFKMLEGDNNA